MANGRMMNYFSIFLWAIILTIAIAGTVSAQDISVSLNSTEALLHVDSASWNDAWIELSGTDEIPEKDDFTVTNGTRKAEILSIDSIGWKFRSVLALSVVLDNSSSMFYTFDSLTRMCDSLADSLPPGVIAQAVTFDNRYRNASYRYTARSSAFIAQRPFTDSLTALKKFWHFFDTIRTDCTPLYDAIAVAATNIGTRKRHGSSDRNDVLLVVTDGQDNASQTSIESLMPLLASAHLKLFAINFRVEDEGRLPWLARHTGGNYFLADHLAELQRTLKTIGHSLTRAYRIHYRFPTLGPSSGK